MALRLPASYYEQLAAGYAKRREVTLGFLEAAGFRCFRPAGAYYIMTDVSGFGFSDDLSFARFLVEDVGLAVVPGSSFYQDAASGAQQVRFTFCKTPQTLAAAAERLSRLPAKLAART